LLALVICFLAKLIRETAASLSVSFLKFRNNTAIKNPIQNSRPAKANKKNVRDIKFKSSFMEPK
jgi:hypothetical protein